jgi:uncharacterized lipoprotein YddW (UPF0748 family)
MLLIASCSVEKTVRYDQLSDKAIEQIPNELRGAWVTRFAWASENPDTMKSHINNIMKGLADANFNAVFFQLRGQAETLYPSPYEPWSKLVGFKDPGFDPVKLAIDEAHKHGLKFYAYINLMPMWNEDEPPADTNHIFYKHGPNVNPDSSWVCFGDINMPMERNEYYYFNPALPEVKTYLKKVIRHFVESYDIDGLHFDRIRYPGPDYLNDPYSIAKISESSVSKARWARQQLSDLVEDVVVEAMMIKPYLVNSAATWGMYRTDDIKGYEHFGSGYANYYQDAIDWLDKGIMDFIVPMIYWDMDDPLPNFDDLWLDFKKRTENYKHIYPGLRIREEWIKNGETASQINFVRQNGGLGTVMFSIGSKSKGMLEAIRDFAYPAKVNLPAKMKRVSANQVMEIDVINLLLREKSERGGSWIDNSVDSLLLIYNSDEAIERGLISLLPDEIKGISINLKKFDKTETTDVEGKIGAILPTLPDTLHLSYGQSHYSFPTEWWRTPNNYILENDGKVTRKSPWVEFRKIPRDTTYRSEYDFLAKTEYPAKAWINNDSVKVYKTGIFFNKVQFSEGANRVEAKVLTEDSARAIYVREFNYVKRNETRKQFPLWINERSIKPNDELVLLDDDIVRIEFMGSKEQEAAVEIIGADLIFPCTREDHDDFSIYAVEIPLRKLEKQIKHNVKLILKTNDKSVEDDTYELLCKTTIQVKYFDELPLVKTVKNYSVFTYTLGEIRLGGPLRAEYPRGIILKTSGKIGSNYRIRLNKIEDGYIDEYYVEVVPEGTLTPRYYISSLFCAPTDSGDIVRIPYPESIPYAIYPEPNQKRILIDLYGVETSSTWITHKTGRKVIEQVTWQQTTPETYQIMVNLKSKKIWGYDITRNENYLIFRIKYPPEID